MSPFLVYWLDAFLSDLASMAAPALLEEYLQRTSGPLPVSWSGLDDSKPSTVPSSFSACSTLLVDAISARPLSISSRKEDILCAFTLSNSKILTACGLGST